MKGKNLACTLIIALPLIYLAVAASERPGQSPQNPAIFGKSIQPFFSENCYQCHDAKLKTSNLNLEAYQNAASLTQDREKSERILYKLRTGLMPPKGVSRPDEAAIKAVTDWIEQELEAADRLIKPDPGRVTAHRLNRSEYNNTVRDLLGVDLRLADDFPQDDSGYGFDNIGDVLSLSPVLMEKYLAAAEKIARTAVFGAEPLKPTLVRRPSPERRIVSSTTPLFDYDLTGLSLPNALHVTHRFPVDGEYIIRVVLGGVRPAGSEPLEIGLWLDGHQVQVQKFDPAGIASFSEDRQDFAGMRQEFRARVAAGDHWMAASLLHLYEGLPAAYGGPNPSKKPPPPPPEFKPPPHLPPQRIEELRKKFEARRSEKVAANEARISSLEVAGPYSQTKGPPAGSPKKILVCGHLDGHHQLGCARTIVTDLARRAYRRPVTPQEVDQLVKLVSTAQLEGDSFEEGLCVALEAMLVSPHFLFRIEKDSPTPTATSIEASHPVSQHELASRLSYFLWSSMPDDELLACADRGILRQPAVLEAQVRRLLQDPKSRALAENFAGQWLELRKLESAKRDRQRFPEFDEYLRMSMRRETELFFDSIVREDRSILDFIDGNYTFLNDRLAKFYQIPGVKGAEFRKVLLTDNAQRGGVFTQASVLTVSSYATRTSPVLRGKWILDNILNDPPPPPLPDVPNLDEAKIGTSASLRQQLEQHRKNSTCAACHGRMDPLGFGLENFDAIGAWRTQDGTFPIDASGTLPDGRSFQGPQELKAIVKAQRDAFAECLTGKLLTYALGRGLERYDKPTVKKIARGAAANNYRFSSLVLEIVKSLPFQMRRGVGEP
ncbi:MAG TPA: DUF1592 domain-containing protein [Acidobacteriota bacterium]|jgi:mono/diheme cytochrome c family protein